MSGYQGHWSAHQGSEHSVLPSVLLINRVVSVLHLKVYPAVCTEVLVETGSDLTSGMHLPALSLSGCILRHF